MQIAVRVEVLRRLPLHARSLEPRAGLHGLIDDVAGPQVAQLHPHLSRAAAHLVVLQFEHLVKVAVDFDCGPLLEVPSFDHLILASVCVWGTDKGSRSGCPVSSSCRDAGA